MDVFQIVEGAVIVGLVGFVWKEIRAMRNETRKEVKSIREELKAISASQHQCQTDLPKEYATRDNVDRLWERTDRHSEDLSYLKGKFNGQTV